MDINLFNNEIRNWFDDGASGLYITLNGLTNDRIIFEQDVSKLAHKLNDYCYGRLYKKGIKRLKIIASIEQGNLNRMLHSHLIVTYDKDMKRPLYGLNAHIRKHWYKTLNLSNQNGNMVKVDLLNEINSRISYTTKDTNYFMRSNNFNIVVF